MDRRVFGKEAVLTVSSWFILPKFISRIPVTDSFVMRAEHLEMLTEARNNLLRSGYLTNSQRLADQYLEPVQFNRDDVNPHDSSEFSLINRYGHKLSFRRHSDGSVHFSIDLNN
jgi:hypothetical protein